ncbi:MAG: histidine kinase [Desulfobaccales bacterium]|jgi:two-component system sensor histidine kinase KdpD
MAEDKALSFLRLIRRAQRGKLKIYLGYGAGVGKTWQMLQEGRRLKEEGIDIVVGLVETHGRVETGNLLEGLEVVPRRQVQYRGITLEEMDLDAVLARHPEVALVDELAHSNVPGSKNPKRYQDVEDLLRAGIHVISTLNIQHLESLYDLVETHIGVKVHERIPDTVLAEADEIINVDISPEDLLRRLREGKIYPPERVSVALENFFTRVHLDQLRELTLRELASQIDLKRRTEPEENPEAAPEQVMVCISSRGPNAAALLRYGSRLAGRLSTNWYAVYVQTPKEESTIIDAATQRQLSDSLTLAKQLGALVFPYKGEDIVATILHFASEYHVGHIVIGKPGRLPAWRRWLGQKTVAEQLIFQAPPGVTIVVVDTSSFLF